jgi:hypothetical protein
MLFWLWKEIENECMSSEEDVRVLIVAKSFAHPSKIYIDSLYDYLALLRE